MFLGGKKSLQVLFGGIGQIMCQNRDLQTLAWSLHTILCIPTLSTGYSRPEQPKLPTLCHRLDQILLWAGCGLQDLEIHGLDVGECEIFGSTNILARKGGFQMPELCNFLFRVCKCVCLLIFYSRTWLLLSSQKCYVKYFVPLNASRFSVKVILF